ncbi:MAG: Antibiotic efflux pump outer membrane protein ArpC [Holosporales bacterium]
MYKLIFSVSVLLMGCAPKDLYLKKSFREDLKKQADSNQENIHIKNDWWQSFEDSALNRYIEEAFKNAPTVHDAKIAIDKAHALYTQATGQSIPIVEAKASYMYSKQSYHMGLHDMAVIKGMKDYPSASINASYAFDIWDKNKNELESILSTIEAAKLGYQQTRMMLAVELTSLYITLDQLYKMQDVVNETFDIRKKTKELFEKRFKEGVENESSAEQAAASYYVCKTEQESIQEQIELTRKKICVVMGRTPDQSSLIERPRLKTEKILTVPSNLSLNLIGRRLDVLIQKAILTASAKNIDVAESGYYPQINIVGSIGLQSLKLNNFTKKGASVIGIGPSIDLPIFNQRFLDAQYSDAVCTYNKNVVLYESTILNALNDVQSQIVTKKSVEKKIKDMTLALHAAEKAYNVAKDRYKGGLFTYIDVLRAEDAFVNIKRALTDLHSQAALQEIQLIRALGGGYADGGSKNSE